MRFAALAFLTFMLAAACGRNPADPSADQTPAAEPAAAPVSDELPGLAAPATDIDFWDHPTLSFNGMMIVATANGVYAYNMEDGNPAAQIDGVNAAGVAVSYLGFGREAAGFAAVLDATADAFRFYGIDNSARAFLPLNDGPAAPGDIKGFCLGRALQSDAPALFVVVEGKILVYNLAAGGDGIVVESESAIGTPGDIASCAVDIDGVLLAGSDTGAVYRIAGDDAFAAPFARAIGAGAGELTVLMAAGETGAPVGGQILFADLSSGTMHLFDRVSGAALGAAKLAATDNLPGVDAAEAFGATAANLGALYRNGVVAYGVAAGADGPVVRLAPVSSVRNALAVPVGEPVSPRGAAPAVEDGILDIPTTFTPEE